MQASKSLSFIGWIQCHIDYANSFCECLRHTLLKLEGKYLGRQDWILKPMSCYISALLNYVLLRNQLSFPFYKVQLAQDVLNIDLLQRTGMVALLTLWAGIFYLKTLPFLRKKYIAFNWWKWRQNWHCWFFLIKNNKIVVLGTSPSLLTIPIFHFEKEQQIREVGEEREERRGENSCL